MEYRRQIEGDITNAAVDYIGREAKAKQPSSFLYGGLTNTHYSTLRMLILGEVAHRLLRRCDHDYCKVLDTIKAANVEDNTIVV
ncbi:MAG: hypothetical protein E5W70_29825 [Mesorhizobium sp.]|uniref:hypothetical protein n=1 Tax=Mesorhizobium sp. TaxID=1871066 RepID=UPI00120D220F|nr:hypothetical protein [Mesorhizobium sp.]TIT18261.1 MAG: hypothetical protein E5W70_29825 [Mesorhizobium sp.]